MVVIIITCCVHYGKVCRVYEFIIGLPWIPIESPNPQLIFHTFNITQYFRKKLLMLILGWRSVNCHALITFFFSELLIKSLANSVLDGADKKLSTIFFVLVSITELFAPERGAVVLWVSSNYYSPIFRTHSLMTHATASTLSKTASSMLANLNRNLPRSWAASLKDSYSWRWCTTFLKVRTFGRRRFGRFSEKILWAQASFPQG